MSYLREHEVEAHMQMYRDERDAIRAEMENEPSLEERMKIFVMKACMLPIKYAWFPHPEDIIKVTPMDKKNDEGEQQWNYTA